MQNSPLTSFWKVSRATLHPLFTHDSSLMLSVSKWTNTRRLCTSPAGRSEKQGATSSGNPLKSIQGQNPAWCSSNNHVAVLWINPSWPILSVEGSDCWEDGGGSGFTLSFPGGRSRHLFTRVQQRGSFCVRVHIGALWQVNQWGPDAVSCWFTDPLC